MTHYAVPLSNTKKPQMNADKHSLFYIDDKYMAIFIQFLSAFICGYLVLK